MGSKSFQAKVLCWAALDRAVRLAPALGEHARVGEWGAARDEVRAAILERGWSERRRPTPSRSTPTSSTPPRSLCRSSEFCRPPTSGCATIEAIAGELTEGGLVLRYRSDEGLSADGLSGEEGTFVICSFWLVSCLAKAGELERPEELFDRLAGYADDLGLLAEEIGTATGEQLRNFPQAFSHIGLITAARAIDHARGDGA